MTGEKFTATELDGFYKTLEQVQKGEMPLFTAEEAHEYIREQYKKKK